jgi:hypothetical protein
MGPHAPGGRRSGPSPAPLAEAMPTGLAEEDPVPWEALGGAKDVHRARVSTALSAHEQHTDADAVLAGLVEDRRVLLAIPLVAKTVDRLSAVLLTAEELTGGDVLVYDSAQAASEEAMRLYNENLEAAASHAEGPRGPDGPVGAALRDLQAKARSGAKR